MARKTYYHKIVLKDPCVWCGGYGVPTLEHIHPKIQGGPKRAWLNQAGACRRCNNRRGDWSILEFLLRRPEKRWKGYRMLPRRQVAIPLKAASEMPENWYYPLHNLLGIIPAND